MTTQTEESLTLHVERTIRASRERVFRAWTDIGEMRAWSGPAGGSVGEAQSDLRVGGQFRITLVQKDGTPSVMVGEYREVTPPERLVYTHAWIKDNGRSDQLTVETLVTVQFTESNGVTRVALTQTGFDTKGRRDGHVMGWSHELESLQTYLEEKQS